ncbi:MAG: glucosidase, partial [Coraliomargarita sp.]
MYKPNPKHPENVRLKESSQRTMNWQRWGPYLSERQWGTVREDYSEDGNAWASFPYEHSISRAYRWGEDGLLGFTDRECRLCFAPALWNGKDPHLKERLFGLTGPEGNHGEDVKELYYYLDSLPTHAYAKGLYKYPQAAYPYDALRSGSRERGLHDGEFEIDHTGVFDEGRYFDCEVEYAKQSPNDLLIRMRIHNRGPEAAELHVLPTIWYRNTWAWGCEHEGCTLKPLMQLQEDGSVLLEHTSLGRFHFWAEADVEGEWLFTENETNTQVLWGDEPDAPYVKDGFHRCVVNGESDAVNPEQQGTKAAMHYRFEIPAGGSVEVRCRLASKNERPELPFGKEFNAIFNAQTLDDDPTV